MQRSAKKDHWKQLQRMKHVGSVKGSCIFLIEGDLRTAERFTAYGAQEMQDMTRNSFSIQDQSAALRFLGRAILACKCLRFIQSDSEVASYEAITAVAIVAVASRHAKVETSSTVPNVDGERCQLLKKLQDGGVPREIASCVADEVGSTSSLRSLFESVTDEHARSYLLTPIVEDVCRSVESHSSPRSWSAAIHSVVFSNHSDAASVRESYTELKQLVQDEARLLVHLYAGLPPDEAVDAVWAEVEHHPLESQRRLVKIEITESLESVFAWAVPSNEAFYRLRLITVPSPRVNAIPVVAIRTTWGDLSSDRLLVFVLEGSKFVRRLKAALSRCDGDYLQLAKEVAQEIRRDCHVTDSEDGDKPVLLLHGLQPALDQFAKQAGYCLHSRVISSMLLAQLMLVHDTVVLQAVRKSHDCQAMLQQLILSCFQFQLLPRRTLEPS